MYMRAKTQKIQKKKLDPEVQGVFFMHSEPSVWIHASEFCDYLCAVCAQIETNKTIGCCLPSVISSEKDQCWTIQ